MNRAKKKSTTVFSRDAIGVEQLQSLKEKFAGGDLNEQEFVSLFREIIDASLSEAQLTELFQKIDANSDGTVDWDELTNYMFLSGSDNAGEFIGDGGSVFYETFQPEKLGGEHAVDANNSAKASSSSGGDGGSPEALGTIGIGLSGSGGKGSGSSGDGLGGGNGESASSRFTHHHKDLITRVIRLDKPALYITASKDGSVRTWNASTLQFQSVLTTGKNWLTDCCVMRRSNRLAVSSMNRTLGIYDLGSNTLIGEITEYSKRQCIPLCLEYVQKPADDREALVVGDDTGGITVMTCSDQWLACDGRSSSTSTTSANSGTTSASSSSGAYNPTNAARSASLEAQGFASRVKFKKHTDWVTRVKWVNDMRAIVATSLDTNISIIDIDRMVVKFEYNRHKKGVFDLVWCSSTRLIASCGMERDISIWNPYSSQRAVATLRGHTSSVVHLASDDDNFQIISVASDNTFKVWDVRNHRCLQTWVDRNKSTAGHEHRISSLLFDDKCPSLVTGTTHLTRWPFKEMNDDEQELENGGIGGGGRERPMSIASYNGVFHQVVTAEISAESVVKTWSAETGDEICSFSNAHGQSPVTAISFDFPGRRLLTGGHDGTVIKMWNFSNGALVKRFLKQPEEHSNNIAPPMSSATAATSSSAAGSSLGNALSPKAVSALASVTDDLAFLGLESGSSKPDGNAKNGDGSSNTLQLTGGSVSPRKRKVRDIMLLPPTFGIDWEGRKTVSGLADFAELPSPTRTRLRREKDDPRKGSKTPKDSDSSLHADNEADIGEKSIAALVDGGKSSSAQAYREKEVTSILDIERNLRVGMGDYICQRFVCSVGWDRKLFIWVDKNEESEALPAHVLPHPAKKTGVARATATGVATIERCHTMDIMALVFIPPAYIATSGLDGKILLWSINSGDFLSAVYQSSGSIDTMWYAPKIEMLFASGDTGQLVCMDRSMTAKAVIPLAHPNDEAVTALRCDKFGTLLVSGDAVGHIKVWDLAVAPHHDGVVLDLCCQWHVSTTSASASLGPPTKSKTAANAFPRLSRRRNTLTAQPARVLGIDFIEHSRVSEPYALISSANGDVTLWTVDGVQVGCFGRHRTWHLGKPATYMSSVSSCVWPVDDVHQPGESDKTSSPARSDHHIKCFSIAALSGVESVRDTFLLEDSMPKPGEVWVCISGHRARATPTITKQKEPGNHMGAEDGGSAGSARAEDSAPRHDFRPTIYRRHSNKSGTPVSIAPGARRGKETLASLSVLQLRLSEVASEVMELITVVKVARGEITCWFGNAGCSSDGKPAILKTIEMTDFVRKAGWGKQALLSQYIGRIFTKESTHFQVAAIGLTATDSSKPDRKSFLLVDTTGQAHAIQPLNEATSIARLKIRALRQTASPNEQQTVSTPTPPARRPLITAPKRPNSGVREQSPRSGSGTNVHNNDAIDDDGASTGATVGTTSDAVLVAPTPAVIKGITSTYELPLIRPREKRMMGGQLPKRSTVRIRHDQSVDFRRVHSPAAIPKSFRAAIQQKFLPSSTGTGDNNSNRSSGSTNSSRRSTSRSASRQANTTSSHRAAPGFDGVLPEE